MKLNKINEVWNSVNPLFKRCFGLLSSKNFATMATWRNDFSSLYTRNLKYIHYSIYKIKCLKCYNDKEAFLEAGGLYIYIGFLELWVYHVSYWVLNEKFITFKNKEKKRKRKGNVAQQRLYLTIREKEVFKSL